MRPSSTPLRSVRFGKRHEEQAGYEVNSVEGNERVLARAFPEPPPSHATGRSYFDLIRCRATGRLARVHLYSEWNCWFGWHELAVGRLPWIRLHWPVSRFRPAGAHSCLGGGPARCLEHFLSGRSSPHLTR